MRKNFADPNPFLYAFVYLSTANMWRIFVKREPKFADNLGIFLGAATGYATAYMMFE